MEKTAIICLLVGLLLLSLVGLVVLYSASGQNTALVIRQCIRLGIAFSVMIILAQTVGLLRWLGQPPPATNARRRRSTAPRAARPIS